MSYLKFKPVFSRLYRDVQLARYDMKNSCYFVPVMAVYFSRESMTKFNLLNLFAVCVLICGSAGWAAEDIDVMVVTEELPPYQILQENGELTGYSTEVIQALIKMSGDNADIEVMPWARAYQTVLARKNTLIFSIARTPSREKLFIWGGELAAEHLYLWALKSNIKEPLSELSQIRNYTLAVTRQTPPEQYFSRLNYQNLHRVVRPTQNVGMLFHGRVDLIISTEHTLRKRVRDLGYDFALLHKVYSLDELSHDLYFAFNLDSDPALVTRYQNAFEQLNKSGELKRLRAKWQVPEEQ